MTDFKSLEEMWCLISDDGVVPAVSGYRGGAIAPVFIDRDWGSAFVNENLEAIVAIGGPNPRLEKVGPAWAFMQRCAGNGLAGINVVTDDDLDDQATRFLFFVRVDEAASQRPTVLVSMHDEGWRACLTRTGVKPLKHVDLLHWNRLDVLDRTTARWGKRHPFRDFQDGDPMYEIRTESAVALIANVPLLGDWNSDVGAFAFFTTEEAAEHYLAVHLFDGQTTILTKSSEPNADVAAGLRVHQVDDLAARLSELETICPLAAWCANPDDHRENSAYGRLGFGAKHPMAIGGLKGDGIPRMAAVSGVWEVLPGNVFAHERLIETWSGLDTILWSKGQSLNLLPLDRSFCRGNLPTGMPPLVEMTPSEMEEWVEEFIGDGSLEEDPFFSENLPADAALDLFVVKSWDSVTGGAPYEAWRFSSALDALRYLAAFEREHDRHRRAAGAHHCSVIGFRGSGDEERETATSARFQAGLRRMGVRVLRDGYRPEDAEHLVHLCNEMLSTLHVDYAGYVKDLLWATEGRDQENVFAYAGVTSPAWETWASRAEEHVDPEGERLGISRLGAEAWKRLLPKSRKFVATALLTFRQQGIAPQFDYAPISIEVVKALEVELAEIVRLFRATVEAQSLAHDPADQADRLLAGLGKPTLGNFPYLLEHPKGGSSPLRLEFWRYLEALSNFTFLTSQDFAQKHVRKASEKFRNGGAHESVISYETCLDCIDTLLGSEGCVGSLAQLVGWKGA